MKLNVKSSIIALLAGCAALTVSAANAPASSQSSSKQSGSSALQSGARQQGEKISLDQLPQQAKQAILRHSGGANPSDVRKLDLNGKHYYTATFDQGKTKGKMTVAQDGSIVSLRESTVLSATADLSKKEKSQLSLNQVPQPVQRRIHQEAGTSRIGNLSQTEVNGRPLYRADFDRDGVRHELFITPQGAIAARVMETTVASQWTFDENGNLVANPNREIKEAAGAQAPTQYNEQE
jgi:hypothetical protein